MYLNIIKLILIFGTIINFISAETKIVNGTNARIKEFPYLVSVRNYNSHLCGGTIINKKFILTAAHCVDRAISINLSIQYGVIVIDTNNNNNIIHVKKIIRHEDYSPSKYYANDIAVLELKNPILFNDFARPVILPKQNLEILRTTPAIVMGWGSKFTGGPISKNLQKVSIFVYTAANCMAAHGSSVNILVQICAGVPEGGKGQCSGDSGGPLIVKGFQAGIVSWSVKPCTIKGYPGVFTKVSAFVNWIKNHTTIKE